MQTIGYHAAGPHEGRVREVRTPNGVVLRYRYDSANRLREVHCGGRYRVVYAYDGKGRLKGFSEVPIP